MTPEQLEAAARLVCEKRGVNPYADAKRYFGDMEIFSGGNEIDEAKREIKAQYEVLTSIATVLDMEVK